MQRPGLDKLMNDVKSGKISKIVVWRLDRLGRTPAGLHALFDELQRIGVGFVSLRDGCDISTAAGRLLVGVLASVAKFETEVRRERQLAGIERAKAKGVYKGRAKGTRVKVTVEKEAIILRLKAEGTSVSAIARNLGVTRKTVYRTLKDSAAMAMR